ncbi:hypothetical protein NKR23_g5335 [Pleurostoma richardsiae]|uniref:Uncharacterized protein n=1 Tax=Pleurostoma richardsiae TaxID=41990 RepID=A0AA38VQU9_9PEZI|nr:hypothetical protein NKR23_g5335 [Pleurostoma richardsiae]
MAFVGTGRNPKYGLDEGGQPPLGPRAYGIPGQYNYAYYPYPGFGGYPPYYYPQAIYAGAYWTAGNNPVAAFANTGQHPSPEPLTDPAMPAANMSNSTGGVGCEPGYNYFFPGAHTKIHVLKSGTTPPWRLPAGFNVPFHAAHVPTSVTLGQLLKGFGANNPNPKKNRLVECYQGGNGRWYKGLSFGADDKDNMKKRVEELGWDETRTGLPGEKPVVFLYITKD